MSLLVSPFCTHSTDKDIVRLRFCVSVERELTSQISLARVGGVCVVRSVVVCVSERFGLHCFCLVFGNNANRKSRMYSTSGPGQGM
jgi:hypothetical protein